MIQTSRISNTEFGGTRKRKLYVPRKIQREQGFTSSTNQVYSQDAPSLEPDDSCMSYNVPQVASGLQLTVKRELPDSTEEDLLLHSYGFHSVENRGVAPGLQTIIKQESSISSDFNLPLDLSSPESIEVREFKERSDDSSFAHVEKNVKKTLHDKEISGPLDSIRSNKSFIFRKKVTTIPAQYEILRDKIGKEVDLEINYKANKARSYEGVERTLKEQAKRDRNTLSARVSRAFMQYLRNTLVVEHAKAQQNLQKILRELKSQLESVLSREAVVPVENSNTQDEDGLFRSMITKIEEELEKLEKWEKPPKRRKFP